MTKTNSCWQHKEKVQRHVDQDCRPAYSLRSTWPIVATVLRATSSLGLCQGFPLILILSIIVWASHSQEEGSLESPIYFLQMMWFCWCHLVVICSSRWHRWAECRAAGMRISFSSVYSRSRISFRTNQFKHLRNLFMNEGREEREAERCRSVVVKSKLIVKAKLLIYRSVYIPTLTNSHRLRLNIQNNTAYTSRS